jgi:hypothetical protein
MFILEDARSSARGAAEKGDAGSDAIRHARRSGSRAPTRAVTTIGSAPVGQQQPEVRAVDQTIVVEIGVAAGT